GAALPARPAPAGVLLGLAHHPAVRRRPAARRAAQRAGGGPAPGRLGGGGRMTRARGARRAVVAGVPTPALTGAVAACAPAAEEPGEVGSGYVSGDGSGQRWGAGERTGPLEMSGTSYDGSVVDLAELRGSVVVLNTWYAACPPC